MTDEAITALVRKHATELGEHFESVRIFVTFPSEDDGTKTRSYDCGTGNWYAQYGSVLSWVALQDEETREWHRKQDDSGG